MFWRSLIGSCILLYSSVFVGVKGAEILQTFEDGFFCPPPYTLHVGTLCYYAPEILSIASQHYCDYLGPLNSLAHYTPALSDAVKSHLVVESAYWIATPQLLMKSSGVTLSLYFLSSNLIYPFIPSLHGNIVKW